MGGSVSISNNPNSHKHVKQLPAPRKRLYIGLRNYGCTCYANSVIQLLYYCDPFRMKLEQQYCHAKKDKNKEEDDEDLGYLLCEIFNELSILYIEKDSYVSPRSFISSIFNKSRMFGSSEQQDAHEFLMYLLNDISDTIKASITNKNKNKKGKIKQKVKDTTLQLEQENNEEREEGGEERERVENNNEGNEEDDYEYEEVEVDVEVDDDGNEINPDNNNNDNNNENDSPRSLPPPATDSDERNALVGSQSKSCVLQPEIEIPIDITNSAQTSSTTNTPSNTNNTNINSNNSNNIRTFIEELFEGTIISTVKCLTCNNISTSKETFLHLSVDVVPNVSLTDSLRKYCGVEHLNGSNQFFCQKCNSLQDAEKSIRISKLPPLLIIHIKRFKYNDKIKDLEKLCSRVLYPYSLRVPIQSLDEDCISPHYILSGTIVHIGHSGLSGHYVCTVDDGNKYIILDDHNVNV